MEGTIINYDSPIGTLQARFGERGLYRFGHISNLYDGARPSADPEDPRWTLLRGRLDDYFKGMDLDLFGLELDISDLSTFRKKVYLELIRIPKGGLITYAELAARAGYPKGARAVGTAMKWNPLLLIIPCHRVVAKGPKGGYRIGGFGIGTEIKQHLLSLEGSLGLIS